MKREEFNKRRKQAEYLERVNVRFEAFLKAFRKLNEIWQEDSDHDLCLNDYLAHQYPFDKSFDETLIDVGLWYADGASKVVRAMYEIQPHWTDGRILEEPAAEYDHHQDDDTNSWEYIAEQRMKEIRRLRGLLHKWENTTFIKEIGTEQTGGGVMVDFVTFKEHLFVLGITDVSVVLYKSMETFCGDEEGILDAMSLQENNIGYQTELTLARMRNKTLQNEIDWLKGLLFPVYYVIKVYGDVEPELSVPSKTEEERDQIAKQMRALDTEEEEAGYSGFYWLNIIGGKPEIGSYSGAFFNDDDDEDIVEEQRGDYHSPQTSMFTHAQMTGSSAQMNILDQINDVADTIARIRATPHILWTHKKHSWIEVKYADLVLLDVHLIINGNSFRNMNGELAFLDTNADMEKYIKAIFGHEYKKDPDFKKWRDQMTTKKELLTNTKKYHNGKE